MQKIIRFTIKCILMLMPLLAIVAYTWLMPMGYMDKEYPSWHYTGVVEAGKAEGVIYDDASLILGDSRAMADIVPELLGDSYVNLGVGGATPIEMYYTLEHYISNNGVPRRVMIMFAPFHYSYMDNYRTRTMYFHHLTLSEALDVYSRGRSYKAEVFDTFDRSSILSMYLRLPDSYLPALINAGGWGRMEDNKELYSQIVLSRGHGLYGTDECSDDLNYEANYLSMDRGGEHMLITYYFDRLLKLCDEKGIETYVLQAPMNEASYNSLHEEYVKEYLSYMKQFAGEYGNVVFETSIPCYDNEYFGDSSHLNLKGSRQYTDDLLDKYAESIK